MLVFVHPWMVNDAYIFLKLWLESHVGRERQEMFQGVFMHCFSFFFFFPFVLI